MVTCRRRTASFLPGSRITIESESPPRHDLNHQSQVLQQATPAAPGSRACGRSERWYWERRAALRALLQQPLLTPDGAHAGEFALVHTPRLAGYVVRPSCNGACPLRRKSRVWRRFPGPQRFVARAIDARSEELFTRTATCCLLALAASNAATDNTLGRIAERSPIALRRSRFRRAGFLWSLDNIPATRLRPRAAPATGARRAPPRRR